MRTLALPIVLAGLFAHHAHAVDRTVFRCEAKTAAAITRFEAIRSRCLVKCQQAKAAEGLGSTRVCSGLETGFPDLETATCLGRADGELEKVVSGVCGSSIPDCGRYAPFTPGDAAGLANDIIATEGTYVANSVAPNLLCQVEADPDPAGTLDCEVRVVAERSKLAKSIGKCLAKCYVAKQLKSDGTKLCAPRVPLDIDDTPFDTLDSETLGCATEALGKSTPVLDAILNECLSLDCGPYLNGTTSARA